MGLMRLSLSSFRYRITDAPGADAVARRLDNLLALILDAGTWPTIRDADVRVLERLHADTRLCQTALQSAIWYWPWMRISVESAAMKVLESVNDFCHLAESGLADFAVTESVGNDPVS